MNFAWLGRELEAMLWMIFGNWLVQRESPRARRGRAR